MIEFRCWKCHRKYRKADKRIGERFLCNCDNLLRVPKRSGDNCRVKSAVDWIVETIVCAGGGAFLGLCLGFLTLKFYVMGTPESAWMVIAGSTLLGFLAGLFGGERGIDWLGNAIREREDR